MDISITRTNRRPTYAQWITKAIASSQPKALTLADINEWMIQNVPGLQELRYLHSCKGWKNAVRHTLSINRHRFKKVTRDGKPSLWSLVNEEVISNGASDTFGTDAHVSLNNNSTVTTCNNTLRESPIRETKPRAPQYAEGKPKITDMIENFVQPKIEKEKQQLQNPTQTLEILYSDGISGSIILPSPLPISNLNFGGLLFNTVAPSVIPVTSVASCNWFGNSNLELSHRMSMNDLANFRDLMKSNAFIV